MNKRWIYVAGIALALFCAFYFYQKFRVPPVIDFDRLSFTTLEGEPYALTDRTGTPLVVCFAASWCGPCRHELDDLSRVSGELGDARVVVIGEEPVERLRLMRDLGGYPFEFVKMKGSFSSIGIHSIPMTYLVDRQGDVAKKISGAIDWRDPSSRNHLLTLLNK